MDATQQVYEEGVALFERGKYRGALSRFYDARAMTEEIREPQHVPLYSIAVCELSLGNHQSARSSIGSITEPIPANMFIPLQVNLALLADLDHDRYGVAYHAGNAAKYVPNDQFIGDYFRLFMLPGVLTGDQIAQVMAERDDDLGPDAEFSELRSPLEKRLRNLLLSVTVGDYKNALRINKGQTASEEWLETRCKVSEPPSFAINPITEAIVTPRVDFSNPESRYESALASFNAGQLDQATEYVDPLIGGKDARSSAATLLKSMILAAQSRYREALRNLQDNPVRDEDFHASNGLQNIIEQLGAESGP